VAEKGDLSGKEKRGIRLVEPSEEGGHAKLPRGDRKTSNSKIAAFGPIMDNTGAENHLKTRRLWGISVLERKTCGAGNRSWR